MNRSHEKKRGPALTSLALALTAVLFLGSSCVSEYFYDVAIKRKPQPNTVVKNSKDIPRDLKLSTDWFKTAPIQELSITSHDGLKLVGYYSPAATPTKTTVIMAHGYTGQASHMAIFAKFFQEELGFNVLLPDARGHGKSEGDYIGFGWPERKDWLQWIDLIIQKDGPDAKIALMGVSMGGATVMMVSGETLPPQVKAVVEDCGYTSAYAELAYNLKRSYGLGEKPILVNTSAYTKKKAGYSFEEASALEQVKKTKLPMLFIHGEADTFVPFQMVNEVYAAHPGPKEIYTVPGAGHGAAFGTDPDTYKARVKAFLDKYL